MLKKNMAPPKTVVDDADEHEKLDMERASIGSMAISSTMSVGMDSATLEDIVCSTDALNDALGFDGSSIVDGDVMGILSGGSTTLSSAFDFASEVPPPLCGDSPTTDTFGGRSESAPQGSIRRTDTANSIDVGSAMGLARHHSGNEKDSLTLDAMADKASNGNPHPLSRQRKGSFAEEAYTMGLDNVAAGSIPNLRLQRPRTSSSGYLRERCLHINIAGNKTSFGVVMIHEQNDQLDYVRRYMTKRFWRELSGRNWGFLSREGDRVHREQEKTLNAWSQGYVEPPSPHHTFPGLALEQRHLFVFADLLGGSEEEASNKRRREGRDDGGGDDDGDRDGNNGNDKHRRAGDDDDDDSDPQNHRLVKRFRSADRNTQANLALEYVRKNFAGPESVNSPGFASAPGTFLMIAARGDMAHFARRLLVLGADPNAADADGNTPLHAAAVSGHIDVVRVLLSTASPLTAVAGPCGAADAFRKNAAGQTAAEAAEACGKTDTAELIREHSHRRELSVSELVSAAASLAVKAARSAGESAAESAGFDAPTEAELLGLRLANIRALALAIVGGGTGGWSGAGLCFCWGQVLLREEQEVDITLRELVGASGGAGRFCVLACGAEEGNALTQATSASADTVAVEEATEGVAGLVLSSPVLVPSARAKLPPKARSASMIKIVSPPPRAPRLSLAASMGAVPRRRVRIAQAASAKPPTPTNQ
jgi:hypothetical protein